MGTRPPTILLHTASRRGTRRPPARTGHYQKRRSHRVGLRRGHRGPRGPGDSGGDSAAWPPRGFGGCLARPAAGVGRVHPHEARPDRARGRWDRRHRSGLQPRPAQRRRAELVRHQPYTNDLSRAEILHLTRSMVAAGETLSRGRDVVADKHSIGGVACNRVTLIIVCIVAATGTTIPKTSSRAVASAAGPTRPRRPLWTSWPTTSSL